MKYGIFAVRSGGRDPWSATSFYEPVQTTEGDRLKASVDVSGDSPTKIVVLAFVGRGVGALERVCVKYVAPCTNTTPIKNIICHHKKTFFDIELVGPAQMDITESVKKALAAEDKEACRILQAALRDNTNYVSEQQNLLPLAHWMRCFSLEQPQGTSPVMLHGLPMALSLDPELVADALPRAFDVVCAIAPKLRNASSTAEIGLCFAMLLRAFSGQYASERKDDRSLIGGMLAVNDGWDCDDMSLMSFAVIKAMQRIRGLPSEPVLRKVVQYAQTRIKDAFIVHGLALTPQQRREGHVWLGLQFAPLQSKGATASGATILNLDGPSFRFGEATCFSALDDDQYRVATMPVSFDVQTAMRNNRHKCLSAYGECGVNPPISGDRYAGVQIIGTDKTYLARTRTGDNQYKLGVTAEDMANPDIQTELVEVKYAPLPENKTASETVRSTIMGYSADLFRPNGNAYLQSCIESTKPAPPEESAKLLPGTVDVPWRNYKQQPKFQAICASVQWSLKALGRPPLVDTCRK